ncbi:MAG: glycosyltransferase family A protein [Clostridia bacterium]
MKISILTPTYNREKLLVKLYSSLLENSKYEVDIEWLIMDDGSTDNTKTIVEQFIKENKIEVKYYYQKNQGKMIAINNLVQHVTGDLMIDCDSDDYFTKDAFKIIKEEYEKYKNENCIYGLCFLKFDQNGNNMGNMFKKKKTTMFDLYFKEGETGEKALVFISDVRKNYKHELENNEKFVTEARMYHKMDEKYKMICINEPIMICEYQESGYTKNIKEEFIKNPFGYYEYFKEILQKDMKGASFKKRLYAIKHYILFSHLTKQYCGKFIKGLENKVLYYLFLLPGIIKSSRFKKMAK